MENHEIIELTFRQILDLNADPLAGEVYGEEFRTRIPFDSGRVSWEEAEAFLYKTISKLGLKGWTLVSVTKFPLHLGQEIHIFQSFYLQRPVTD